MGSGNTRQFNGTSERQNSRRTEIQSETGKYVKLFLDHPDVPIDNLASERAIRTFCLGKKNWIFRNTANGAVASALVYSISATAKLNGLHTYYIYSKTSIPDMA